MRVPQEFGFYGIVSDPPVGYERLASLWPWVSTLFFSTDISVQYRSTLSIIAATSEEEQANE